MTNFVNYQKKKKVAVQVSPWATGWCSEDHHRAAAQWLRMVTLTFESQIVVPTWKRIPPPPDEDNVTTLTLKWTL